MPGYTQLGLRQADSISGDLQPMRYMLAVGPPRSEMTPVKPVTLSRISSISLDDRVFAAALDDAALVLGDRAEGAAAKAAAHDVHREADHFPGGDLGRAVVAAVLVGVARMRAARVRQVEHVVHLGRGQRDGRRR